MKKDYHLHTEFSADSKIVLSELVPLAVQLGYSELAITEHLDLLPGELTVYGVPSLVKYRNKVMELQKQYPAIKLICGIEVGEFQDVRELAVSILDEMKFGLILGSVHFTADHVNVAVPMREKLNPEAVSDYYERNLALVETCDINVLAHLGVYKRYYDQQPDEAHCQGIIRRIFEIMVRRGIALEINFSGFRRSYKYLHPETEYLELYSRLDGKLVTIGSDAHTMETFNDYYHIAQKAVSDFGFEHLSL